ncbi:MAG: polynucleotide adenylyltransferase PcnB, partial [Alcaligenaceae bacterium]|nr:polynucleotide adenylyltransferase PcnB [Alcaligenaceae bacterium]
LISNVPDSRLFDETLKLMTCGNALACLKQLRAEGLHDGTIPLLDIVLKQPGGQKFVELTLDRTDHRVRSGKSVSPSFLYAALLWRLVDVYWKRNIAQKEPSMQALVHAADQVLNEQVHKLAIQRRHSTDMREIWFMQPRFERPIPRQIWKMTEQPRFRAACDFLQLRAASGEFDSVQAQWWMDLADGDAATKTDMIEELIEKQKGTPGASAPRKRKRRRPATKRKPLPQQNQP